MDIVAAHNWTPAAWNVTLTEAPSLTTRILVWTCTPLTVPSVVSCHPARHVPEERYDAPHQEWPLRLTYLSATGRASAQPTDPAPPTTISN